MKINLIKKFSYVKFLFHGCQVLLVAGIIIQCLSGSNFVQSIVSLLIYGILLAASLWGEKQLEVYVKHEIEEEIESIASIKDSMFVNVPLPVVIVEEVV